ncbi:Deoxyguanosinetriphosphate triphosphohydrolase [Syntrophomonas zehnderi OL-4]|uniref:Deoxyguanosinetriphosphate triphosphohydrolase n=1 Tax=Syntrophomonas zehnderi OL-4 TaxID=690567 RepID=A0A0E4C9J1_9FIRM|nr:deoxyguanosinetriphosphate triphosphohydrolase [Syntrophomonas zehnderi]CFY00319.1 Deoxyguanosinetriphosphate triphosphohydrolase [Syntrophomonas zehnderi OL-4]
MNIREEIEKRENSILHPLAAFSATARPRAVEEEPDPIRTCFMLDRDRIIHSKSFRRLKHKTQVFIAPPGDHYRTRLTHTLEVNQIAKTIGAGLNLNLDLIEAVAMGHDVGHTPFAHAGEQILNELVTGHFRHNENSIRVLTRVEQHKGKSGLNLSPEVLDGVLHHSGYGDENLAYTLEGQVIRLSDKIAYVQHDIDDSIRAGLLTLEQIPQEYLKVLGETHSKRIATLVTDTIYHTRQAMQKDGPIRVEPGPQVEQALRGLREFMFETIYRGSVCQAERRRAMFVIEHLFNYYKKFPARMSPLYQQIADEEGLETAVVDYISGMSDAYCISLFEDIYVPQSLVPYTPQSPGGDLDDKKPGL